MTNSVRVLFMGFLGRKKDKKISNNSFGRSAEEQLIIKYLTGETFDASQNENALKLSAVYSAISIISNTMSKIPFSIIDENTKEKVQDINLIKLLNLKPNDKMNIVDMHKLIWNWALMYGNAYLLPIRKFRSTEIEQLLPIHPDRVTIIEDNEGNITYKVNLKDGRALALRYDEIIHIKEQTIDGINGVSPLEYGRLSVQTGLNQEAFSKSFYENYGRPDSVLMTQTDLSSKKIKQTIEVDGKRQEIEVSLKDIMREEWKKAHSGENKFSTAILDNGLEYREVNQLKQSDMEFVSSKQANVEDIARFFDMASCSFKLGIGKQTYSNNEQGQICYVTETIVPRLRKWEKELTLKLLTEEQQDKGWVVKGNINAELRGDTTARAAWYDKMRSMGVYNINEIRELEDMPSIGEDGETRLIGANSIPLQKLLAGETAGSLTPSVSTKPTQEPTEETEEAQEQPTEQVEETENVKPKRKRGETK
jgi:HK97 family phage portal protein